MTFLFTLKGLTKVLHYGNYVGLSHFYVLSSPVRGPVPLLFHYKAYTRSGVKWGVFFSETQCEVQKVDDAGEGGHH